MIARDHRESPAAPTRYARVQGARDYFALSLRHPWSGDPDEDSGAADQGIEFSPWGIAIVKAVVLAKFMLLGEAMKIGGRTPPAR